MIIYCFIHGYDKSKYVQKTYDFSTRDSTGWKYSHIFDVYIRIAGQYKLVLRLNNIIIHTPTI